MRILYAYPSYFTEELIDEIASNPKARARPPPPCCHCCCWRGWCRLRVRLGGSGRPDWKPCGLCGTGWWGQRRRSLRARAQVCKCIDTPLQHISTYAACCAAHAQVCKYIDIPLQHINNLVLLSMNRPPQDHTVKLLRCAGGRRGCTAATLDEPRAQRQCCCALAASENTLFGAPSWKQRKLLLESCIFNASTTGSCAPASRASCCARPSSRASRERRRSSTVSSWTLPRCVPCVCTCMCGPTHTRTQPCCSHAACLATRPRRPPQPLPQPHRTTPLRNRTAPPLTLNPTAQLHWATALYNRAVGVQV